LKPIEMAKSLQLEFRRAAITEPEAAALIEALNRELDALYPEAGANHFRLDADEVTGGRGGFLIAWAGAEPVGCGAIRRLDAVTAEIKRMYVVPAFRGYKVGSQILAALETMAREIGCTRLVLETGDRQGAALRLYESAGFERTPPYGEYVASPLSVCLAKELGF
jgi:putative acetyltransferase